MDNEIYDKPGFIRDMAAALGSLRAAILADPQRAASLVETCILLESAMGRLNEKRIDH